MALELGAITNLPLYLVSNASLNVYPRNKPQNFKIQLPIPHNFEGEWEVALSSIYYPHNWNQVKGASSLTVNLPAIKTSGNTPDLAGVEVKFPYQQFTDIVEVIKILNETTNEAITNQLVSQGMVSSLQPNTSHKYKHIEFALSETLPRKVQVKKYGYSSGFVIGLPRTGTPARHLWQVLGFDDSLIQLKEGTEAKYPASLTLHMPALFVYTGIIEYVGVGDTYAPLLSIVPVSGLMGEYVYQKFDKPIYTRINRKYISEIDISIKDDTGEDVQFGVGKTILTLHFRRRA